MIYRPPPAFDNNESYRAKTWEIELEIARKRCQGLGVRKRKRRARHVLGKRRIVSRRTMPSQKGSPLRVGDRCVGERGLGQMARRNPIFLKISSHLWPMGLNVTILPVAIKYLPISPRFTPYGFFYRGAYSALLQLVNQWFNFTYSRSHAFRYGRKNTNSDPTRIELATAALAGVQVTY